MITRVSFKQAEIALAITTAAVGFIVYLNTLCPTVNFIDSGELATVCYKLGVAHPTGYPLFTLVGYLFSHIPMGMRVIYQLNLFAAVLCSVGLFIYFRLLVFLFNTTSMKSKQRASESSELTEKSVFTVLLPAFAGTLLLGFSKTYWSQALSIEVYSLHIVLLGIVLLSFIKAIQVEQELKASKTTQIISKQWLIFAYVLGLAFTNHLSTIFLAPALLVAFFSVCGFSKIVWKRLLVMGVPFLMGFSVYLYLPFRAINQPVLNWGNPVDFSSFIRHLTGKVYRVWFLDSSESVLKQFKLFFETLPSEFAYVSVIVALLGCWKLLSESRRTFIFTCFLFMGSVIIASFYDIHDIETYFLLAYLTMGIWIAFGIKFFIEFSANLRVKKVITGIIVALIILTGYLNYNQVDESNMTIVEQYTNDMLSSVAKNGIVLTFQWDYFVSAAYYLQFVEGVRPDVIIIDKELLRRTWYFAQLQKQYPWLMKASKDELDSFLKELYKFENDLPYDPRLIEFQYTSLIHSIVEKNWNTRPVYCSPEIEQQYINIFQKVPSGLIFRLYPGSETEMKEMQIKEFNFSFPHKLNKYSTGLLSFYSQSYMNQGMYLQFYQKHEESQPLFQKGKELQSALQRTR